MSYGDKTRAMLPLINGKLTAVQIAERVGCDAKTVRAVAKKHRLPLLAAERGSLHKSIRELNERRHAEAEEGASFVWHMLRDQIETTGRVSLVKIADGLGVDVDAIDGYVIRLRNHGRLKRKSGRDGVIWMLFYGDEKVCESASVTSLRQKPAIVPAFHVIRPAGPIPTSVEDAKLYLRRRGDYVHTEGAMHRLNYRTWMTDDELLAFCEGAKKRDASLVQARKRTDRIAA